MSVKIPAVSEEGRRNGEERTWTWFRFLAGAVIALHVWGAWAPAHLNWGVHLFAFFPWPEGVAAIFLAALLFLPGINRKAFAQVDRIATAFSRLSGPLTLAILAITVLGAALFWSVQLHLLGDGAVLLRSNATAEWGSDLVQSFSNQPLMRLIYRNVWKFFSTSTPPTPREVYLWIDLAAAVLFTGILYRFLGKIDLSPGERLLLGVLIFSTGSSQFFFGYVENYVLQYVFGIAFLASGWLALREESSPAIPLICFGLLVGLHLGFLIFTPAAFYLLFTRFRHNMRFLAGLTAGAAVAGTALLFLVGFTPQSLLRHLTAGSVDFLQPFTQNGGNFPYPMFSLRHLLDWANGTLLVVPAAIPVTIALGAGCRPLFRRADPVFIFLLISCACGLLFTLIINFALGIARDWDLFSTFLVPVAILDVYLLLRPEQSAVRRKILVATAAIAGLHFAAWVGINADAGKHLARMKLLHDPLLLSLTSQLVWDEALANYYFDGGQYADARVYYEKYLTIDDHNPRIIGNIADTYRKLGEKERYFAMLQRAAGLQTKDPGVYTNLGVEYAARGDTARAISSSEQALVLDPNQPLAQANLGILYAATGRYTNADRHFTRALTLGMREPSLFLYAGDVAALLHDYPRALQYYNSYLELVPNDRRVGAARDALRSALSPGPATRTH
ncbi:MAG TPA: tetratricopeptide repeat protein [Bacteroidota bacterium]|nr:tetratricopeptide repeat protein [Bacteroidota bacterium]